MKKLVYLVGVVFVLTGCIGQNEARPQSQETQASGRQNVVPGEYIITLRPAGNAGALREIYAAHGVGEVRDLGRGRFLIRLAGDPGLEAVRKTGLASGKVEAVQPNFVYRYR